MERISGEEMSSNCNCTKKKCRFYDKRSNEYCGAETLEEMKSIKCPYVKERLGFNPDYNLKEGNLIRKEGV